MLVNLTFAWLWFLMGLLTGAGVGFFFARPDWLGGYDAWPRRMVRLGHIAFFGTGLLNLSFALTQPYLHLPEVWLRTASILMIAGGVGMPAVCFLSAWRKPCRHLFVVPVVSLFGAVVLTAIGLLWV